MLCSCAPVAAWTSPRTELHPARLTLSTCESIVCRMRAWHRSRAALEQRLPVYGRAHGHWAASPPVGPPRAVMERTRRAGPGAHRDAPGHAPGLHRLQLARVLHQHPQGYHRRLLHAGAPARARARARQERAGVCGRASAGRRLHAERAWQQRWLHALSKGSRVRSWSHPWACTVVTCVPWLDPRPARHSRQSSSGQCAEDVAPAARRTRPHSSRLLSLRAGGRSRTWSARATT